MQNNEKEEFNCDIRKVQWRVFFENYFIGLSIWVLKEDNLAPHHNFKQIVMKNSFDYFSDYKETMGHQLNFVEKDS